MGATIAEVTAALATAFEAVGVGAETAAAIASTAVTVAENAAISAAIAYGASLLTSKPSLTPDRQKRVFNQSTAPRLKYVGECKVGGPRFFLAVSDGRLYQGIMLNQGRIHQIASHFLGADVLTVNGSGVVTSPDRYQFNDKDFVTIAIGYGGEGQAAFAMLTDAFPGDWTDDHRGRGIACVAMNILSPNVENFTKVFPAGLPEYNAVIQAGIHWDPRSTDKDIDSSDTDGVITATGHGLSGPDTDAFGNVTPGDRVIIRGHDAVYMDVRGNEVTLDGFFDVYEVLDADTFTLVDPFTGDGPLELIDAGTGVGTVTKCAYSTNGVVQVLNYLIDPDGARLPRLLIERALSVWQDQADIADEAIDLKAGGTEPRYRLGGGYALTDPPKAVLPNFLVPMDARLSLNADGGLVIDVGHDAAATFTMTDAEIIDYTGLTRCKDRPELRNDIRAQFVSAAYNYEPQDADPWEDETSIDTDGRQTMVMDNMLWCVSHAQCRRRMKVESARQNPAWSGEVVVNAQGLRLMDQRYVVLQIAELGIDTNFEIVNWKCNLSNLNCTLTVSAMPADIYEWDAETEEGTAPVMTANPGDSSISAPEDFTASSPSNNLEAGCTDSGRDDLQLYCEYSNAHDPGDDDIVLWHSFPTTLALNACGTGILSNGDYDVRGRWVSISGATSDWEYVRAVTVAPV